MQKTIINSSKHISNNSKILIQTVCLMTIKWAAATLVRIVFLVAIPIFVSIVCLACAVDVDNFQIPRALARR